MISNKKNKVSEIINYSNKISSVIFNRSRITRLTLLSHSIDGLQFRELKALLNISDGKLKSDLDNLADIGYIEASKVKLDQKKVSLFIITENGIKDLKKLISWFNLIKSVIKEDVKRF